MRTLEATRSNWSTRGFALAARQRRAPAPDHQTEGAAGCQAHLWSGLRRGQLVRLQAPLFPGACGCPSGSNVGTVDPPLIPINLAVRIERHLQGSQHAIPAPVLTPAPIAVIDRAPRPIALGNV